MNQTIRPMTDHSPTTAWRLWIDRCGGYGLLTGDRLTLGGSRAGEATDIQVRCDWRRREGVLTRRQGDYFWSAADFDPPDDHLIASEAVFPIQGSAVLRLKKPSVLSGSAVLSLDPPHRFENHIDQILLVDQTVLIGPSSSDHIRSTAVDTSAVLVIRDGVWRAKLKSPGKFLGKKRPTDFIDLVPGRRVSIGELDMMLEIA